MFASRFFRPAFKSATRDFTSAPKPRSTFTFQQIYHSPAQRNHYSSFRQAFQRPRTAWQDVFREAQAQRRGYRQQVFNYQRVLATGSLLRRWAARPTFYYEVGGIGIFCGGWFIYNLETVPVSGRRRFNVMSPAWEKKLAQAEYQEVLQQYGAKVLPEYSPQHQMAERVMQRLVPHSGLTEETWEVRVIKDEMKNAFVLPGGKVFVFTGLFDICKDEDSLAAVLGHEIAHNVAHHAAEKMSKAFILLPVGIIASIAGGVDPGLLRSIGSLAFELPNSRKQEEEADYIGLLMMAESCYKPSAALQFWAMMERMEQYAPPQMLSTHPSHHNRLEKIRTWLDQANVKRENSDCAGMIQYADGFRHATSTYG